MLGKADVLIAMGITIDSMVAVDTTLLHYESFYTLATDVAGNVEAKHVAPTFYTLLLASNDTTMGHVIGGETYPKGETLTFEAII